MFFIILPELVGNKPCSDHLWEDIKYRYFPKLFSKSISKRKISRPHLIFEQHGSLNKFKVLQKIQKDLISLVKFNSIIVEVE